VVLMIDGIHFGGQVLVVALGIAEAEKSTFWECGKEPRRTPLWSKGCWKIWGTADWI